MFHFSATFIHIFAMYKKIRTIVFYKEYFQEFFSAQKDKVKDKIIWTLTLIEEIERVSEHYLKHLEVLFSPNKIIISGGVCKKFVKYEQYLSTELEVVPAKLLNNAGIIGAAMGMQRRLDKFI